MRVSERAEKCVHERTQRDLCWLLLVPPPLVDHGPFVRLELAFRARGLLRFKEPMTSYIAATNNVGKEKFARDLIY